MGQPTPPGDIPLIDGLGPEWNEFVSAIPEDKRAEIGPKLKERISSFEPLKQWEDLSRSGVTAEQASNALNLFSIIENNPKDVYDTLGKYLNVTKEEVKEAIAENDAGTVSDDPRLAALQQQVDTLAQIALAQRQQSTQEQAVAEQEQALEEELGALRQKYGDVPDNEIVMRMLHHDMSAEEAYQDYAKLVETVRSKRPAPFVMGAGGNIPSRSIDVTKLPSQDTKKLVAQMLDHANQQK
jgi:DNA-binding transcriptional MerR regulator